MLRAVARRPARPGLRPRGGKRCRPRPSSSGCVIHIGLSLQLCACACPSPPLGTRDAEQLLTHVRAPRQRLRPPPPRAASTPARGRDGRCCGGGAGAGAALARAARSGGETSAPPPVSTRGGRPGEEPGGPCVGPVAMETPLPAGGACPGGGVAMGTCRVLRGGRCGNGDPASEGHPCWSPCCHGNPPLLRGSKAGGALFPWEPFLPSGGDGSGEGGVAIGTLPAC